MNQRKSNGRRGSTAASSRNRRRSSSSRNNARSSQTRTDHPRSGPSRVKVNGTNNGVNRNNKKKNSKRSKNKRIIIIIITVVLAIAIIIAGILLISRNKPASTNHSNTKVIEAISSETKVGDIISLGKYEQDNNSKNGKESIEWQVIDVQDEKALIISCAVLECKAFNESDKNITWKDSSVRDWLNSDFYNSSFTDEEKNIIIKSNIENPSTYSGYDKSGCWLVCNDKSQLYSIVAETKEGKPTKDYAFLLSVDEVMKYFPSDDERKAYFSDYATESFVEYGIKQAQKSANADEESIRTYYDEACKEFGKGFCNWWLRSPGTVDKCFEAVNYAGDITQSKSVVEEDGGIRPAMWISIG